jgi:hypothetical protein
MEKCPLCDTERVAGESLCPNSKCGYEFSNPTEPEQQPEPDWDALKPKSDADWPESKDSAVQPDQEWLKEHAEPKDTPTQDDTAIIEEQPEQEKQESSNNVTRYYIEDGVTSVQEKPSTNGTKVNGQNITGQGRKELENGNEIKLSHVAEVTFQIDSDGQGKILLPNNTEILFEGDPKPVGRDDLAEFLNSVNLDPFEISRVQFTISKE